MSDARVDKALAPIETVISALGALVALSVVVIVAATAFGSGSFLGFGDEEVCAEGRVGNIPFVEVDVPARADDPIAVRGSRVPGLAPEGRWFVSGLGVCNTDPGTSVRIAGSMEGGAGLALTVGFLVLARGVVRSARRRGLFSREVPASVRRLGWFLSVGGPAAALAGAAGNAAVIGSVVSGRSWSTVLDGLDLPWAVVIAGVAMISVARVLEHSADLQDDVDSTV